VGRSSSCGPYSPADHSALDLAAGVAALAATRFRARLEYSHLASEHALMTRLAAHASGAGGEEALYQTAVDTVLAVLGFSGCTLFLVDPSRAHMTCVASRGDAPAKGTLRPLPPSDHERATDTRYSAAEEIAESEGQLLRPAGARAFLLGAGAAGRVFTDTERRLFASIACSLGTMVEAAIAAERERERLHKTEMLLRLAHALGSKTTLEVTLEAASVEAGRMLSADCVSVFTVPRRSDQHHVARHSHSCQLKECPCRPGGETPQDWIDQIMSGRPTVRALSEDQRRALGLHARTVLVAPLHVDGAVMGAIVFRWRRERALSDDVLDFAGAVAEIAALAVEKARLFEDLLLEKKVMQVMNNELAKARDEIGRKAFELKLANERIEDKNRLLADANRSLEAMADRDGMTGVANHRSFQERLRQEMSRASRHGGRLSLILLDVDWFKRYNDDFGHPQGDEVLRLIARTVTQSIRPFDFVARYGGEEFVVILPKTGRRAARAAAERIRKQIQNAACPHRQVTASLGVSTFPSDASSVEELVDHADAALYAAKNAGRNRVMAWTRSTTRRRRAA
jgi:diguanylate cyclase (GGDEF)-like protein